MSFSSVWGFLSLHQHLNRHIDFQERVGGWHSPPAQVPDTAFRESGGPFPRGWPYRGPMCFAFSLHLFWIVLVFFAFLLFFLLFLLFFCFFLLFTSAFCHFFQKVSSFRGPQFGSGTFPFGWPPVHLAGVSLDIARSSASRVHLGPPFSSLMFPLSSAQVLIPCPG